MSNESNSIIKQVTSTLRTSRQKLYEQAFSHGWNYTHPDQVAIDCVARNVANDVLHEINCLEEQRARISEEIKTAVDDIREGLSKWFPQDNDKAKEHGSDKAPLNYKHDDWDSRNPRRKNFVEQEKGHE